MHPPAPVSNQAIQAKLRIGPVDDPLEREADRVADALVEGRAGTPHMASAGGIVQRQPMPPPGVPMPPGMEPLRPLVTSWEVDTKTSGQKLGKGAGEAAGAALDTAPGKALQDAAAQRLARDWENAAPEDRAAMVVAAVQALAGVGMLKAIPEADEGPPAPDKSPKIKIAKDFKVQLEMKLGWKDKAPDGTEIQRRTPRIDAVTVSLFYAPEGPAAPPEAQLVAEEIARLEAALAPFRPKPKGDGFAIDYAVRRALEERARRQPSPPSAEEAARARAADRFKLDAGPFGGQPRQGPRLVPRLELSPISPPGAVQRKCAACAAEEDEADETVQLKGQAAQAGPVAAAVAGLGHGIPLPTGERGFFEPRLGRDLSQVRVHVESAEATAIGARAFTLAHNVAFAPGEWRPGTTEGRRLLGHELAHVLQQGAGGDVVRRQQANPIDAPAQALIDLAADSSRTLEERGRELIGQMLAIYFAGEAGKVAEVRFVESEPGLSTTYRGPQAERRGIITVGRNFVTGTTRRLISRRVAQLAHELQHVDQQRAGMAGADRSDEREFLAFADEAAFTERPGTGTMPHSMRVTLVDAALGYYNCLGEALQRQYASRKQALLTLRATHDGQAGNATTTPPTACRRQG